MSAACSTSCCSSLRMGADQRRSAAPAAWQAAPRGASVVGPRLCTSTPRPAGEHRRSGSRRLARPPCSASSATADLAVYQFAQRRAGATAEWFQAAVKDIVRHVDSSPFLQTVRLNGGAAPPRFDTYGVQDSVVSAPELWQGIAEHVSQDSPDVVILVQRVSPQATTSPQGAMEAAAAADAAASQQQASQGAGSSSGERSTIFSSSVDSGSSSSRGSPFSSPAASPPSSGPTSSGSSAGPVLRSQGSQEMRVQAEEACRRLVASGLADRILTGQVGDCCDGEGGHTHSHPHGHDCEDCAASSSGGSGSSGAASAARQLPLPLPSIVPFSPSTAAARRAAVRTAALRAMGAAPSEGAAPCSQQAACYWGVVVQSRHHTGAEGCYLLKTVRNVTAATGCTCTHFSLTRVAAGEHLEAQFVQSWLL